MLPIYLAASICGRAVGLIESERVCYVEKLVLVLRDGRKLIGVLRSWDQFGT